MLVTLGGWKITLNNYMLQATIYLFIYLFSFFDFVHARSRVKRFKNSSYIYHEIFLFGKQKKRENSKRKNPTEKNDTRNHTLSPLSDFVSIMVRTVSYRMALPTFLLVSVFVATCNV